MVEQRCRGYRGKGGAVGTTTCGPCVEDFSLSRAIVSGLRWWGLLVGKGRWKLSCRDYRVRGCCDGGYSVDGYCVEAIVSGAMVSGAVVLVATASMIWCRGRWCWGCCVVRVHVKSMIGGGFGGGNGGYCGYEA